MPVMKRTDECKMMNVGVENSCFIKALFNLPVPLLIAREDGRMVMINHAFQDTTGLTHEDIPTIGALTRHVVTNADNGKLVDSRWFLQSGATSPPLQLTLETADGHQLVWELSVSPLGQTADGRRHIIMVAVDVTQVRQIQRHLDATAHRLKQEVLDKTANLNLTIKRLEGEIAHHKRTADALENSRKRLKNISKRTLKVLEADRRTVSKELHDGIGASLAAIKFSLEEKEIIREKNRGCLAQSLNQEIAYLLATIKETKRISANLRPTTLDDLGLMATIEWFLRQFQRLYGDIRVDYRTDIAEEDVPEVMKIIIYRIIQECLTNAQKHSEAKSVRLQIGFSDGKRSISTLIEDDGRGFDINDVFSDKDPLSGYGLIAMRERCEILGGSFHIASHPGQGTRINAILPL
jgi:PAS domain S-box-containing protein